MRPSVKVALLGQNSIIREGLRRILADENFAITQSVNDASSLSQTSTDEDLLIVVDGEMQAGNAEGLRLLHDRHPTVKLVVLSEIFDFEAMVSAFRAGACGYLVKEISFEPLIGSLHLIAMGEKVMPSRLAEALPLQDGSRTRDVARRRIEQAKLSHRESEILGCLIIGSPNKAISRRLDITEATVKVHVKAILRKLRVQNRTQAAVRGVNGGMSPQQAELPKMPHHLPLPATSPPAALYRAA